MNKGTHVHNCKVTPNLLTIIGNDHNFLFGYREEILSLEDCGIIYQAMFHSAATLMSFSKEIAKDLPPETPVPSVLFVQQGFTRARQHLLVSMPFIVQNGEIISDPNGAQILQRKLRSVYN